MASPVCPEPLRMVRLLTADDGFAAKVIAARLGVEGIVWELRGGVDGPYPFGPVHVFVTQADLEQAQAVLAAVAPLEADADDDRFDADDDRSDADDGLVGVSSHSNGRALFLAAVLVGALALGAAQVVRVVVSG